MPLTYPGSVRAWRPAASRSFATCFFSSAQRRSQATPSVFLPRSRCTSLPVGSQDSQESCFKSYPRHYGTASAINPTVEIEWNAATEQQGVLGEQPEDSLGGDGFWQDFDLSPEQIATLDAEQLRAQAIPQHERFFEAEGDDSHGESLSYQRRRNESVPLTPSEVLTQALKDGGHFSSLPYQAENKTDLTFTSAKSPDRIAAAAARKALRGNTVHSLQSILAKYIRVCADRNHGQTPVQFSEADLGKVFTSKDLRLLHDRQFDVEDVVAWAWVLTARKSEDAAKRLLVLADSTADPLQHRLNKAPIFLLMYTLRRPIVSARALRLCIIHALNVLRNVHVKDWEQDLQPTRRIDVNKLRYLNWAVAPKREGTGNYPPLEHRTFAILLIRLIRHARIVWAEALPQIANMLNMYHRDMTSGFGLPPEKHARLTFLYNRLLRLLSMPTRKAPLLSVEHRQRAQLSLLAKLGEFSPALSVTREGYRAVVALQLAHRKTTSEREWAYLKARSWPPWKDPKSGLDEDMDIEQGISRAKRALQRTAEAGYAMDVWEQAASILSGWDTDHSPTIQTRTASISQYTPSLVRDPKRRNHLEVGRSEGSTLVWAARIQATRTLEEAWACFLTYKGQTEEGKWSPEVCYPMFVKLVLARMRRILQSHTDRQHPVAAGDAVEISEASINPRERPYLPSPPPDEHRFVEMMMRNGVRFSGKFLAFMLSHAQTLGVGIQYIRISTLPQSIKDVFLARKDMREVQFPPKHYPIIAAFIRLVQNSHHNNYRNRKACIAEGSTKPGDYIDEGPRSILVFARKILYENGYPYRPAWYSLLAAIVREGSDPVKHSETVRSGDRTMIDIASWEAMYEVAMQMNHLDIAVDLQGFHMLSVGAEKAIVAALQLLRRPVSVRRADDTQQAIIAKRRYRATQLLSSVPKFMKKSFARLTSTQSFNFSDDRKEQARVDQRTKREYETEDLLATGHEVNSLQDPLNFRRNASLSNTETSSEDDVTAETDSFSLHPDHLMARMLDVPSPANLHAFMRVLGMTNDHEGIVDLLKWMSLFEPELRAVSSDLHNGHRLMRRTIVCARVMLEEWWTLPVDPERRNSDHVHQLADSDKAEYRHYGVHQQVDEGTQYEERDDAKALAEDVMASGRRDSMADNEEKTTDARKKALRRAKQIVKSVRSWGDWPDDDECEDYTAHKRSRLA